MKKLLVAAAVAGSTLTYSALAGENELTANVGVVSNYIDRGLSASDDGIALQGGLDFVHASGAYVGIWASTIDDDGDSALGYELYVGYEGAIEEFGYDVGLVSYHTTVSGDDPMQEIYLGGSYEDFSLTLYKGITSDENDKDTYIEFGAGFDLDVVDLGLHLGYADNDGDTANDFAVTVSKEDFDFAPGHEFGLTLSKYSEDLGDDEDDLKALVYWTTTFSL